MLRVPRFVAVVSSVLLVAVIPATRAATSEPKITRGADASSGEWSFVVGVLDAGEPDPFEAQFCGGSMIERDWVLTAAHCVERDGQLRETADIDVFIGSSNLGDDGERVAVAEIVVPPDRDAGAGGSDVALVRLVEPQATSTVTYARPAHEPLETVGSEVTLLGWGRSSADGEDDAYPDDLQEATLPIVVCGSGVGVLCVRDPDGETSACVGDGGGPVVAVSASRTVVLGVIGAVSRCGSRATSHARVSPHADWIAATIGEEEPSADSGLPTDVYRVSGANRFATAAAFARDRFVSPVPVIYLVTGTSFPDALAAAPVAARAGGLVLLVERDTLPPETLSAIEHLVPSRLVVVGGQGAVSDAVADDAGRAAAAEVVRVAGASRYETATALSQRLFRGGLPAASSVVFLASGERFADALGGAAAAASRSVPLLLTAPDALPETTADELQRLAPEVVYVLGGTGAVSDTVADAVAALGTEVVRIAGVDRFDTASRIAAAVFTGGATEVMAASGANYPDALVGGALGLPLLLLPVGTVPEATTDAVTLLGARVVTILGGTGAVSDEQGRTLGSARV